jgi:hypothetical protein
LNKNDSSTHVLLSTVNTVTSTRVLLSTVTSIYALFSTVTPLHQHIILLSTVTRLHQHMSYYQLLHHYINIVLLSTVTPLYQHMSYYQPLRPYINMCHIITVTLLYQHVLLSTVTSTCPIISRYILTSTCHVINRYTVTSTYVLSSIVTPLRIISCFKIATARSSTACTGKLFKTDWKVNILGFSGQEEAVKLNICTGSEKSS